MSWREQVAKDAYEVLQDNLLVLATADDLTRLEVAKEIAECIPAPDQRNGYEVVESAFIRDLLAIAREAQAFLGTLHIGSMVGNERLAVIEGLLRDLRGVIERAKNDASLTSALGKSS